MQRRRQPAHPVPYRRNGSKERELPLSGMHRIKVGEEAGSSPGRRRRLGSQSQRLLFPLRPQARQSGHELRCWQGERWLADRLATVRAHSRGHLCANKDGRHARTCFRRGHKETIECDKDGQDGADVRKRSG